MATVISPTSPTSPMSPKLKARERRKALTAHLKMIPTIHVAILKLAELYAQEVTAAGQVTDFNVELPAHVQPMAKGMVIVEGRPVIVLNKRLISALNRDFVKFAVTQTNKLVTELSKRAPRAGRAGGFRNPRVFNAEIVGFMQSVSWPTDVQFPPVSFPQDQIATQNMMTNLLTVYAYHVAGPPLPFNSLTNNNNLRRSAQAQQQSGNWTDFTPQERAWVEGLVSGSLPQVSLDVLRSAVAKLPNLQNEKGKAVKPINRQNMGADAKMKSGLVNALAKVQSLGGTPKKDGTLRKPFNPDDFTYSALQSIVAATIVSNPAEWTADQQVRLGFDAAQGKVVGMPDNEKRAYEATVVEAERQAAVAYDAEKKKNKNAIPPNVKYDALRGQMLQMLGVAGLSPATETQLRLDAQRRAVSQYLKTVKVRRAGA